MDNPASDGTGTALKTLFTEIKNESPEEMAPLQFFCREQLLLTLQLSLQDIGHDKVHSFPAHLFELNSGPPIPLNSEPIRR